MKSQTILILLVAGFLPGFSQSRLLFEKYDFDSSYKIIAVCSELDKNQEYKKWSFIISDVNKLKLARNTVSCGGEPDETMNDDHDLEIQVVKDKEVIETYYASPKYQYVNYYPTDSTPGVFRFDISKLQELADQKAINHRFQDISFKNEMDFQKFLLVNKPKKNFLSWEDISEEQSGRFYLVIPKSADIQKFGDGWKLIESELKRITPNKEDYLMSFNLSKSTESTFFYQINTSKSISDKFNLKGYEKSKWTPNLIEISVVWLK